MKKPVFFLGTILLFILPMVIFSQDKEPVQRSITKDTFAIDEVVVTASKVETNRKFVPINVSVINKLEIEQSNESALFPVISEAVPGLFVTQRGVTGFGVADGAAGQINVRGLGGSPTTQVLVLIDGHPQFMGMMGHPLPDAYVTSDAEKVEVIKGPASMLYGSNAMGGVVNIITRKQQKDGYQANGKIMYGSYNTQKYMINGGAKKGNWDVFTSVNHDKTDGHRDSSDFKITNGYVKAGYRINQKYKMIADYSLAQYEAADPGYKDALAGERIDIFRGKTSFSFMNKYNISEGAIKVYYNYGKHDITDGWHSNDEMWGLMFYQGMQLLPGNSITIGYDYMNYGGEGSPITTVLRDDNGAIIPGPNGPQFMLSDYSDKWVSTTNNALYTYTQQTFFNQLTLSAGLRYEMNDVYGSKWLPQAGIAYAPFENTSFKSSYAEGYRPPSIRELYLFPPANDELLPEHINSYEFSWFQNMWEKHVKIEVTGFFIEGDNLIVKNPPVAPPPPQYKNTGKIKNYGIECAFNINPFENLSIHSNYSYIEMKKPIVGTPEQNLFVSARYHWKPWMFCLKLQHIINLYGDNGSAEAVVVQDAYSLLGAKVAYAFPKYAEMFISGENLLDQSYQINYGYPMPGITFFAGIRFHLE